ncbi:DNA-binding protein [Brucellaceae bacterium VT-16-1752]|nr:DNA-binding protein [Brucellaceae bacterium VT-16-1752]
MSEEFYTVDQAAERLTLHPKTVLRLIREGRLKGTKIGKSYRILRSNLDTFAGAARASQQPITARVSCVVDVPDVSSELSRRLTITIQAMLSSHERSPDRVQFNSVYDTELQHLKLIMIGSVSDTSELLRSLDRQLEAVR